MDLSNEVLNIDFGQGATKILEVKVGGKKRVLLFSFHFSPEGPKIKGILPFSPELVFNIGFYQFTNICLNCQN